MNPLALLGGGGFSGSSSASSDSGAVDTASGAFNFNSGGSASAGNLTPILIAAAVSLAAGFLLCRLIR